MYKQDIFSDASKQIKLGFMAGLVPKDKSMSFERILFRATRGNMYLRQAVYEEPVMDPGSGEKVIFWICFLIFYFLWLLELDTAITKWE